MSPPVLAPAHGRFESLAVGVERSLEGGVLAGGGPRGERQGLGVARVLRVLVRRGPPELPVEAAAGRPERGQIDLLVAVLRERLGGVQGEVRVAEAFAPTMARSVRHPASHRDGSEKYSTKILIVSPLIIVGTMGRECGTDAPETETAAAFSRALTSLKRQGSCLLLVGADHDAALSKSCQRFLGDETAGPRRRLFVATDADGRSVRDRIRSTDGRPDDSEVTIVDWSTRTRSAVAGVAEAARAPIPEIRVESEKPSELGIEISAAIAEFEAASGELDPAELRVCFDSLSPVLAEYDGETAFRFLHVLTARIRGVRGMGHFHLPVERDSQAVRTVAPLFDAVVEVRTRNGRAEQRWHLREQDLTTDWLSL